MTRKDINDIINAICPNDEDSDKPCISPKYLRQELEQLALDQRPRNEEPTTKNDLGVELIPKADALDCVNWGYSFSDIYKKISDLSSVTPIRPKGHWYVDERPESDREVICSNCEQPIFKYHELYFDYRPKYCPNCGADMREVEE